MFKTFWVYGQLWFKGFKFFDEEYENGENDSIFAFPVSCIEYDNLTETCYFIPFSALTKQYTTSTIRNLPTGVYIKDLPTYSSSLSSQENFDKYIEHLFRNL